MDSLRCPELDRLGRELIEAYRQIGDTDIFSLTRTLEGPDAILSVHRKMVEHRRSCFLCQQAERTPVRSTRSVAVFN